MYTLKERITILHNLQGNDKMGSSICVIHGPFGSGKSTLLVAMLVFFAQQLSKCKAADFASPRVLLAAHTNVAVDRILTGLLDEHFTGDTSNKARTKSHAFTNKANYSSYQ